MKKKNSLKTFLLALTIFAGYTAHADLPEIGSLRDIEASILPDTASASDGDVYIDMPGGQTDCDFIVNHYHYTGSSGYTRFDIYQYNSSTISGSVLIEGSVPVSAPALNGTGPLLESSSYVSVFTQGVSIGSTAPGGSYWNENWGDIIRINDAPSGGALQSTFYDTSEGYVGVQYANGSGTTYGWIHLKLIEDGEDSECIVLSAGSNPTNDQPVYAGAGDPYGAGASVPVPFIASFLGLLLVGIGSYIRKKRK